jgi:DNA-binding NtrC family response regulator
MPAMMKQVLGSINAPGHLADLVAASIDATIEEKQTILETVHLKVRLQRVLMLLSRVRRTREIHEEVDAATRTHPELNPTVVLEYMRDHRTTVKAAVEALLAQQTGGDPLVGRWLRVNGQRVAWHEAITLTNDGGKSLLIVGPPGSRPEYAAQLLFHPDDQLRAVVVVPCAGLAASLLEREIFGFAPVSRSERDLESFGLLQEVGQGALVLQDIDALTPPLQERVLRLMHARSYLQVGGVQRQRFSGRIVATTRRDLGRLVAAGKFRAELYARLATLIVELLPLQERREDIPHAVRALLKKRGAALTLLPPADLDALQRRDWPMDLDELEEHLVESVVAPAVLGR